jgi:hypothetical protein
MNWAKRLLIGYTISILLLFHLSLFFCEESHCGIEFDRTLLPHELANRIHIFLLKFPMRLNTIQNWAQWILIGEIMLITIEFMRLIRKIFCCIVWIALIIACFLGLLAYLSIENTTS